MEEIEYDVAIVGGGAAGLLAGYESAKRGLKTVILEGQSRVGTKMLITGGGRCNVTNNKEKDDFLSFVCTNSRFLQSALSQFTPQDLIMFLKKQGLPLVEEKENRIYPKSQKSVDVVTTLEKAFLLLNGKIYHFHVKSIEDAEDQSFFLKNDENHIISARSVILTTGGRSYPKTGSSGEGYRLARQYGHSISSLCPALVGMNIDLPWKTELMGVSISNAQLTIKKEKKKKAIFQKNGDIIFTHFGLSGPLIMEASSFIDVKSIDQYTIHLSFLKDNPDLAEKLLLSRFQEYQNREIQTILKEFLPIRVVSVILSLLEIEKNQKCGQLSKEKRYELLEYITNLRLKINSFRPIEEATVTRGGIKVNEINPSTMESKLRKNLHIAGELLDIDALSGGYNLQIAFSTGFVAGKYVLKEE